jgi:hypothetical protein
MNRRPSGDSPTQGSCIRKEVAYTLLLDRVAAEVSDALAQKGIKSILLKGPTVAKWLYRDGTARRYEDIDLLVASAQIGEAERVLSEDGFGLVGTSHHAHTWLRAQDGATVDLHWRVVGIGAHPEDAWSLLAGETENLGVGDSVVEVLSRPAQALHLALHAVQHPWRERQSLLDLERALEHAPTDVWKRAGELARRLDAERGFSAGLRLLPAGQAVVEELGLDERLSVELVLRAEKPPPLTLAFERLASTPSLGAKLRFLLGRLFPSPATLRAASTLARRGRLGLLVAYPARMFWMFWRAAPALAAWRRARLRSRE